MKKILLITTGGTIACGDTDKARTPDNFSGDFQKYAKTPCEITVKAPFCLDSTDMTPSFWIETAKIIRDDYENFDGFVITHGTDTMAFAAAILSCLIQNSKKPIALTGSMKPLAAENSDAPKNLAEAFSFVLNENSFGVRVVFGGKIINGKSAVKVDNNAPEAFISANFPHEIFSEKGEPIITEKFSGQTKFFDKLSNEVFALKLYAGQKLCVPESAKAVIIEAFGTGGVPEYLEKDFETLRARGVFIIMTTQVQNGGTELSRYAVGASAINRFSITEAEKMTPEYALAKTMWAKEYSENFEDFKKLFRE